MDKNYAVKSLERQLNDLHSALDENKKRAEFHQEQRDTAIGNVEQLQKNIVSIEGAIAILKG